MHVFPWQINPFAIKHRCLENCHTKVGISNGTSLSLSLSLSIYIYIYNAHIPMADAPHQSIKHGCLEYCYSKCGTSLSIYI